MILLILSFVANYIFDDMFVVVSSLYPHESKPHELIWLAGIHGTGNTHNLYILTPFLLPEPVQVNYLT